MGVGGEEMTEQKLVKIENKQQELDSLIVSIPTEADLRKKKKDLARIDAWHKDIDKLRSGKLLSRETKRDLIAYSFIAPKFRGFLVFTLVTIGLEFAIEFMNWDGSNASEVLAVENFKR